MWESKDDRKWGHDKFEEMSTQERHYGEVRGGVVFLLNFCLDDLYYNVLRHSVYFHRAERHLEGVIVAVEKSKEKNVAMHEVAGLKRLTMATRTMRPTTRTVGCRAIPPRA